MAKSRDINPARYNMDTIETEVIEQLRRMPLAPSPDLEVPPGLRGVIPERAPALDERGSSLESQAQGIGPIPDSHDSQPDASSASAPTEPGTRQRRLPVEPAPARTSRKLPAAIVAAVLIAAGLLLSTWLVPKSYTKLPSAEGSRTATPPSLAEPAPRPDVRPANPPSAVQVHEPASPSPVREAPQSSPKRTIRRTQHPPAIASAVSDPSQSPRKSGREPDLEEPFLPE